MRRTPACLAAVLLMWLISLPSAFGGAPLWRYTADQELRWHKLTTLGTLLVGTDDSLQCVDGETGNTVWRRNEFKKVNEFQAEEIPGTPLLLVNENYKGKTKLYALELLTGRSIWESERLKGATVGVFPIYDKNMVLLFTSKDAGADKDRPDIIAFNMTTGAVLWEGEFPDKVDFHGQEGKHSKKYTLGGHPPPLYEGDSAYFAFAGLHRYDLTSGKLLWGVRYDVTEGKIRLANAQPVIAGDTIYTSAKGQLRAFDKDTGQLKWTSKDFGGGVAQMIVSRNLIYGRMGGSFYDYDEKEWKLKKPLGVVAVNRNTGAEVWRFDDAKDSITNMLLLEDQNTILIADIKDLIGLDTTREGQVAEAFRIKLEFKNKIGGGMKAARTGLKIAKGGLMGLASKSHDEDPPVAITMRENHTAVIRGRQHIVAFDPKTRNIVWSVEYASPGVSAWENVLMLALTAASYGGSMHVAMNTYLGTSENTWANNAKADVIQNYMNFMGRRYSATKATSNHVYVLTNIGEGKQKSAGIVGVNMDNGGTDYQIELKDKEPDYQVDEVAGRVFNLKEKEKELQAYSVK